MREVTWDFKRVLGLLSLVMLFFCTCLLQARVEVLSKADFLIKKLPGLQEEVKFKQYAGLLPVDKKHNGHMFFWLTEAQNSPETAPLVVWFTGGAGCSSLFGFFIELGPFKVHDDLTLEINPYSWNQNANVMFVDQPIGTGFSYTDQKPPVSGQEQLSIQFYKFLEQFYRVFTEYKDRKLFLSGESYAGNYIPHFASYIEARNKEKGRHKINLVGLTLGNAWVYPTYHYECYPEYAYNAGVIGIEQRRKLEEVYQVCKKELAEGKPGETCYLILEAIRLASGNGEYFVNTQDIRSYIKYGAAGVWDYPSGLEALNLYLDQPDVIKAIHVESCPHKWKDSNLDVIKSMQGIINNPTYKLVPALLVEMPILFYSGQFDLVVSHVGTSRFLYNLEWPGRESYRAAKPYVWNFGKKPAGYIKAYGNMIYITVIGGAHMVPYDVPAPALEMFNRFISGKFK